MSIETAHSSSSSAMPVIQRHLDPTQLQAALQRMSDGLIVADRFGNVLLANDIALQIHGYTSIDEIRIPIAVRQSELEMLDRDGRSLPLDQYPLRRALRGETFQNWELKVRRKPLNRIGIASYSGSCVRDDSGAVDLAIVTVRDITQQRAIDDRALQTEERFAKAFRSSPHPFSIATFDGGRIIDANERFCLLCGYSREEVIGRTTLELGFWESPEKRLETVRRLEAVGFIENMPFKLRRKDGAYRDTLISIEVLHVMGKRCAITSVIDISDQIQTETKLREQADRFSIAQRAARFGVYEYDMSTGVVRWMPELEALYGLKPGEFEGTYEGWVKRLHPSDRAIATQNFETSIRESGEYEAEFRIVWPDGTVRWMHARGQRAVDSDGHVRITGVNVDVTERRRAELAVKESEERFQLIARATNDSTWDIDLTTGKLWWSESVRPLFGYAAHEVAGGIEVWLKRIHPEDRSRIEGTFWEAISGTASLWYGEYRFRRANGQYAVVTDRAFLLRDQNGKACRAVRSMADITERKRVENAQKLLAEASEALARSLDYDQTLKAIANLAIGTMADWCSVYVVEQDAVRRVAVAHKDPQKLALADEYNRKYPFNPNEAHGAANVLRTGKPEIYPYIPPELLVKGARSAEHLKMIQDLGITSVMMIPLSSRGRTFGVLNMVYAESGRRYDDHDLQVAEELGRRAALAVENAWLYRSAMREIEDRKRSEEAQRFLAKAGEILASSLDYAQALQKIAELSTPFLADYCVVDVLEEGDVIRRVGMSHANPERLPLVRELSRFAPRDAADLKHHLAEALSTGRPVVRGGITDEHLQNHARAHKSETLLNVLRALEPHAYLSVPIVLHGRVHGTLGFISAESKREYTQREIDIASDLGRRAALAIENAKLYHRAVEDDRRKNDFIATLAHELRNPLGPIRNGVHLLRKLYAGDEQTDRVRQMIERQARHMTRLVDDLLDVSRITRNKVALQKQPLDLSQLAREVIQDFQHDAARHRVEVRFEDDASALWINGDRTRMAQVLGNLLHNALKFTPAGGTVSVRAERDGKDAVLRVTDTGCGIEPAVLPTLFEPFTQGSQGPDRSKGGLGLGLALVKGLLALHGGSIEVASEGTGRGSVFVVRVPLSTPEEKARHTALTAQPTVARRILLVEDNTDAAESMSLLLRFSGHEVVSAATGAKAIASLETFAPEVVVCDIGLPDMDGYTLCRRLRTIDSLRNTLFIALTGYGQEEDQRRAREAGFDRHLTKPVEPSLLDRILSEKK